MKDGEKKAKAPGRHYALKIIIASAVVIIGLSLLLYPTVADYINSLNYRQVVEDYDKEVAKLDDDTRLEMLAAARSWNEELLAAGSSMSKLAEADRPRYNALLDINGTGVMGHLEIASLGIDLPIYHGTEEDTLQSGVGHLEGSSLPVGGKGVHTLLSGHSGLPSTKLFTNIDRLAEGDTFTLHVLGEVLVYRVEASVVVLPEEAEKQYIDPEADICTLMTCTPYGVNTHRLLVTGRRVYAAEDSDTPDAPSTPTISPAKEEKGFPWVAVISAVLSLAVLISAVVLLLKRKGKKR